MRWDGERESENVEDRRGEDPGDGGGGGGFPTGGMAMGGGVGVIALILISAFLGVDPGVILNQGPPGGGPMPGARRGPPGPGPAPGAQFPGAPAPPRRGPAPNQSPEEARTTKFVRVVMASTEDVWKEIFPKQLKRRYQEPVMVLYSRRTRSACGDADSAIGPFYCPADEKVYLDTSFFDELSQRFKAPGEFAAAYVIAHEVGHHVQKLLGYSDRVNSQRGRVSKTEQNHLSVRLELQADFLAGVWAYHAQRTRKILEPGDLEAAIQAASAVGDDRLQRQSRGTVVPDSFTHGSSAQRVKWFRRGFESGDVTLMDELFKLSYDQL